VLAAWLTTATLGAQFFPLAQVRPGLRGTGRTVFSGGRIDEFQVEILGLLENTGPKQSIVLARLSGGPLETAGVLQGMSGSPVYIDGRLLGAVALAFSFAKEPIAGIRPIQEMIRAEERTNPAPRARWSLEDRQMTHLAPPRQEFLSGATRLVEIATPVSFGGFTRGTIEQFAPQLRSLGLEPRQGVLGGGRPAARYGDPSTLRPGAMISVQLLAGDMSAGAEGTITHIDGRRLWAFGHRFLSGGATELPFARAEVLTILANLATSFKISSAREWMGAITADHSTAVAGELGRRTALVPVSIIVNAPGASGARRQSYRIEMVQDRFLSPFLLQMALYSAMDATERTLGPASFVIRGRIEFDHATPPVLVDNMYAGESYVPMQASLATALPLAYAMQSGFAAFKLKAMAFEIDAFEEKKQLHIDQLRATRTSVRPGEPLELLVTLTADNGVEQLHKISYPVPIGAPAGPLYCTVADGASTNLVEFQQLLGQPPKSAAQVVALLNELRPNTRAYLRLWRANPAFHVQGQDLPNPPPSVALILAREPGAQSALLGPRGSRIAEFRVGAGGAVVEGSKTIQVEVKE